MSRPRPLPGGLYRKTVHGWPPTPRLVPGVRYLTVSDLEALWEAQAERHGAVAHTLVALSVTHPTPHTWYLSTADVDVRGTMYRGLIREHSGVGAVGGMAGLGGNPGVTLTLRNDLGTGGPNRRFMDTFATTVPGYAEPYDLLTATLRVHLYWADVPGDPGPIGDLRTLGAELALMPGGYEWRVAPGESEEVILSFGADPRRYRVLPRTVLTTKRYAHLPDSMASRPMPTWFGTDLQVPLLPLDADGGLFGVGNSPTATPLSAVSKLWTVRADPTATGSGADQLVTMSVRITTGGEIVLSVSGNSTAHDLRQVAQRLELENTGAFCYAVRVWMRRKVPGTAAAGSLAAGLYLDADGLPGEQLIDPAATAETDASIVGAGAAFLPFDIPFQANALQRAAYAYPDRGLWLILAHTKNGGGDLQIELDSTGAYEQGYMATKTTATDEGWKLVGKQTRRGPVRTDFTGIGGLGRDVATGTILLRPPVSVR